MSNTDDWDAVPVKNVVAAPVQTNASNTADWDAVPVKGDQGMSDAEYAQHIKDTPDAMRVNVRGLPGDSSSSDQIPTTPGNTYGSEMAARQAKFQADVAAGREQAPTDRTWADRMIGGGEAALSTVTGLTTGAVGMLAGGVAGAVGNITGGRYGMKDGVEEGMRQGQESLTYQPRTDAGQEYAGNVGGVMANVLPAMPLTAEMSAIGRGTGLAARQLHTVPLNDITRELPAPERIEPTIQKPLYKMTDGRPVRVSAPDTPVSELQSVGAAASSHLQTAIASGAGSDIQDAIMDASKKGGVHSVAAGRHIEASSLPVPMQLTAGQATGDVNLISHEQNTRGSSPDLAQRFNSQNGHLVDNINAIRDAAAPDVYSTDHVQNGQSLINLYNIKDAALNADISLKFKALEDANGGQFPVDGKSFVDNADAALSKKMKGRYVSSEIKADMDDFRSGKQMTYENFENMRTNLAAEARKAAKNEDGNRSAAISIVRDSLESLPMTEESAKMKALADPARSASKARFDLIASDPAYSAAINGTTAADDFINKFVIHGKVNNVKTMRSNLADDPIANQTISAGTVNYLKNRAGLVSDSNNFSQSGFNKALKEVSPKFDQLFEPEQAQQLQTLGNVARYTQEQPRGAYVNNSNTLTGSLAKGAKDLALGALDVKTFGVTKFARGLMEKRDAAQEVQKSLKPGAGIKISDFPK